MKVKKTNDLLKNICSANQPEDLDDILSENKAHQKTFCSYLSELMNAYHTSTIDLLKKVNLERTYVYQLINGVRHPGRDKVLILAIALGCTIEETERLLTLAGRNVLYAKNNRDAIILYGISHQYTLDSINEMLMEKREGILQ